MRRGKRALRLAAVLALLMLACPARAIEFAAEGGPAPGKMRALLIGCDHFLSQADTWPAADNNLRMLSDVLMGDQRRYTLIRSYSGSIATAEDFEDAVRQTFQNAEARDFSLIYISTHGLPPGTDSAPALLLSDGEEEEALDAVTLRRILDAVPGKKLLILDACNSGAMIGKGLSAPEGKSYFDGPEYRVLCSAGGSEASWYFQGAGDASAAGASYFATVLSYGLGARGDHAADGNADGRITLSEIYAFLCDNYAASTPQVYPQQDGDTVIYAYDPAMPGLLTKAVTDITFDDTLLTAGQSEVTFSFTVQRQAELYYQVIYHQDGQWQFGQAQHFLDGEQLDGTVLPGRKVRTLSLNTVGQDAYGYAMIQLITLENGQPVFQGARLLCVQPADGKVDLRVVTDAAFDPETGRELAVLAQHDVPCAITVSILDGQGKTVRRLAYEQPSRPQQLSPNGSAFYWDGRTKTGEYAPPGEYAAQARVRLGDEVFTARSEPFLLTDQEEPQEPQDTPAP